MPRRELLAQRRETKLRVVWATGCRQPPLQSSMLAAAVAAVVVAALSMPATLSGGHGVAVAVAAVAPSPQQRTGVGDAQSFAHRAPPAAAPTRFAVCSVCIPGKKITPGIVDMALENRRAYAERHPADQVRVALSSERRVPQSDPRWEKAALLIETMGRGEAKAGDPEWVMWLDCDALFTNFDTSLAEVVERFAWANSGIDLKPMWAHDEGLSMVGTGSGSAPGALPADLLIARDNEGINSGVFLLRNSPWGRRFIREVFDMRVDLDKKRTPWRDQLAIITLLLKRDAAGFVPEDHVAIVPQRLFNSYPPSENYPRSWESGDFVLHQPNCQAGPWMCTAVYRMFYEWALGSEDDGWGHITSATWLGVVVVLPVLVVVLLLCVYNRRGRALIRAAITARRRTQRGRRRHRQSPGHGDNDAAEAPEDPIVASSSAGDRSVV